MKGINFFTLLFVSSALFSQTNTDWQLKTGLAYTSGFITEKTQTSQLHFNIAFVKNKVELKADGFYFLKSQGTRPRFSVNHQAFLGANYLFLDDKVKPYLGSQIGIAYSKSNEYGVFNTEGNIEYESSYNPLISILAGVNYVPTNRLYFWVEGRQIFGKHISNSYSTFLDEFRVSLGIGIYLINKTTN